MESDERFKHLALDPRFKTLRKKQRKVQIDDRFKSMFTDEKFTLKYKKDKRGRAQNKTSGDDLKKYYSLEDDQEAEKPQDASRLERDAKESSEDEVAEETTKCMSKKAAKVEVSCDDDATDDDDSEEGDEIEDEDQDQVEDEEEGGDNSESESESELSSSSDESESEEEEGEELNEIDINKVEYDWQPLDHDAETAETTSKRLAVQNLDWDHLDVRDIFTLINSIRPPLSVRIYVSEFGKERLKQEEIEGPKEIIEMPRVDEDEEEYNLLKDKMRAMKNPKSRTLKANEYEDADEEMDPKNEEIRERIRKYQLNRMKYYYAVAEFDSIESAEQVYKELDGMEYEGSSLELDLRFVPDDIEFDPEDIKAECDKLPDLTTYKAPQFINSALQQTNVRFTWDETDIKRQEKLSKAYTKEELDKDDLDAYLASETESDDDYEEADDAVSVVTANSEARINKYKKLLQSLDEEANKKKQVDVDVEWGNYSEDEANVGNQNSHGDQEDDDDNYDGSGSDIEDDVSDEELVDSEDVGDSDQSETSERFVEPTRLSRKEEKKMKRKERRGKNEKKPARRDKDAEEDNDLDLLVMDVNQKEQGEFKFNPEDQRFKAVYESGLYNIDPSHPNFKRTEAFDLMAEKKRVKRQKTRS